MLTLLDDFKSNFNLWNNQLPEQSPQKIPKSGASLIEGGNKFFAVLAGIVIGLVMGVLGINWIMRNVKLN